MYPIPIQAAHPDKNSIFHIEYVQFLRFYLIRSRLKYSKLHLINLKEFCMGGRHLTGLLWSKRKSIQRIIFRSQKKQEC